MEKDGEKLKEYVSMNSRFWTWPPNEYHQVIFLGYEMTDFEVEISKKVQTVQYYFRFANGMEKSRAVRSIVFAGMMAQFKSGDCLKLKRIKIGKNKYEYEVFKIE